MATSGTASFNATRNEICAAAARKVDAIRAGATMSDLMLRDFAQALNAMVKGWQGAGIHVWTVSEATLFPQPGQARYALQVAGADHATQSYVAAELAATGASGATSITLDDDDGIADNDRIGVVLDDGTIFWTQVNGTPAANVVTLDAALTGAAASGNAVYAYTNKITRPLKIVDARRYNVTSGLETPLAAPMARLDYQALPNKAQRGTVTQCFYDPQLTTGYLNLWLVPSAVTELIKFTWWRPIEDFNAAGDNPDLPQEWIRAMIFNLAVDMAPEFSVPRDKMEGPYGIGTLAEKYLAEVSGFDREAEPVQFGIDMTGT